MILSKKFIHKIFFFLIGGFTSMVLQLLIFNYLNLYLLISYLISVSIANTIGLAYGFCFQKFFVFRDKSQNYDRQIFFYLLNGLFNFVATLFVVFVLVEYLTFHPSVAQLCTMALLTLYNYIIYGIIFKN